MVSHASNFLVNISRIDSENAYEVMKVLVREKNDESNNEKKPQDIIR